MNNIYEQVIASLIFQQDMDGCNAVFVKGNVEDDITEDRLYELLCGMDDINLLYHQFRSDIVQPAYNPFLGWIKELYDRYYGRHLNISEFLRACNIHIVYETIFSSYLETGHVKNCEDVVLHVHTEVYSEADFIESIRKVFQYIAKDHKLIIILKDLHYAHDSTLKLLTNFLEETSGCCISMFGSFAEAFNPYKYVKHEWDKLHNIFEKKCILVECGSNGIDNDERFDNWNLQINHDNAWEMIHIVEDCYETIAIKQAEYYLNIMYKQIIYNNIKILDEYKESIIILYALVCMCQKDYRYALILLEKVKDINKGKINIYEFAYYYCTAIALKRLSNTEKGSEQALECQRIADELGDEFLCFKAKLLRCMISAWIGDANEIGIIRPTDDEYIKRENLIDFINEIYNRGLTISWAFMTVFYLDSDITVLKQINNQERDFDYFYKCMDEVKKLNIQKLIDMLYYVKYIMAYNLGYSELDDRLRKENIEVQLGLGYKLSDYTYATMGYYYITKEDYVRSHENNNTLIVKMYNQHADINDEPGINNSVLELLRVLYNMATNCMCAGDFENANKYLLMISNQLTDMNITDLAMCNLAKIYGMMAYCFCMRKMDYNAESYIEKLHRLIAHALNDEGEGKERIDTLFLYYLIKGILDRNARCYESATDYMDKAAEWLEREKGQYFFTYPMYALSRYELYIDMHEQDKAVEELNKCIKYCEKEGLVKRKLMLERVIANGIVKEYYAMRPTESFELEGITLDKISLLLKSKRIETEMIERARDADFLLLWQENLNNVNVEVETMISNVMPLFKKYFNIDNQFLIDVNNKKFLYKDKDWQFGSMDIDTIINFFKNTKSAFLVKRMEKNFSNYEELVKIFCENRIVSLIGIPIIRESKTEQIFIAFTTIKERWIENEGMIRDYRLDTIMLAMNQLVNAERIINSVELVNSANRAKSSFLANISHEIRTPINAILGMDEMILRECSLEPIVDYADNIQNAGKTLLSIINDVLDFSKIESGRMEIIEADYDTVDMIHNVINLIRKKAIDKGLKFIVDIAEDIPRTLHGDEIRIKQVITNILNNAVKYTRFGSVELTAYCEFIEDDGICLTVTVKDTGIGIRKQDMQKLFTNFTRIEEERNRNIEGTGLGMNIVRELLNLMDGTLEVESEYGTGSTFTVHIPQKIVDNEPIHTFDINKRNITNKLSSSREHYIAPKANIMVVDDSDMNLAVVKGLLKRTQISIDTALSGMECLEKVKHKQYDIILLDHMMPGMDGIETLKRMRKSDNMCKSSIVIAITANAALGAKQSYVEVGFDDYIAKPIDVERLEGVLQEYLPKDKIINLNYSKSDAEIEEARLEEEKINNIIEMIGENFINIDIRLGLKYNDNNFECYEDVLRNYCKVADKQKSDLDAYYETADMAKYAESIHKLKSASFAIGARILGEKAKVTEDRAIAGEKGYVLREHKNTMTMFMETLNEVNGYLNKLDEQKNKVAKVKISKENMLVKLDEIKIYLNRYSVINAEDVVSELKKTTYNDMNIGELLNELCQKLENFDADAATEIVDRVIDIVKRQND